MDSNLNDSSVSKSSPKNKIVAISRGLERHFGTPADGLASFPNRPQTSQPLDCETVWQEGQPTPLRIRYGANFKVVGKTDPDKLSYPGAFTPVAGTVSDLATHIRKGRPWMPALLDKRKPREQKYANTADIAALDIDNSFSIQEAITHPFVAAHCCLGIESASSRPELEKFRLVFRYHPDAKPQGYQTIRICNRYLMKQLNKVADTSCKDASRFFFGAPGRSPFLLNESVTLPKDFVAQALAWNKRVEIEEQRRVEAERQRWEEWRQNNPEAGNDIAEALRWISPYTPGGNRYGELITMIGGVLSSLGEAEGGALLREWDAGRGRWGRGGFDRILSSVARSRPDRKATLGTLFYLAKQEGYRPKVKSKNDFKLPDFRKPDLEAYQAYETWEAEQRRIEQAQQQESVFKGLKKALAQASRKLRRPRGFASRKLEEPNAVEYEQGERLAVWRSLLPRYQFIQDLSGTGSGKSFDSGNAKAEDFEAKQLMYVTDQVRNPTVESLSDNNGWKGVEGRHGGLKFDDSGKLRVAKPGDKIDVPGNCARTKAIATLRAKNVFGADTDTACQTCPFQKACKHFTGDGYGFKSQRKAALPHDKVRIHPASLPDPSDYDYSEVVIILDEVEQNLITSKTIEVSKHDVTQLTAKLALENPELFSQVQLILVGLKLVMGQKSRFGMSLAAIKQALPAVPTTIDYGALYEALKPDLSVLEPFDEVAPPELDIESLEDEYKRDREELDRQQAIELSSFVLTQEDKARIKADFKGRKQALKQAFDNRINRLKAEHNKEFRKVDKMLRFHTAQSAHDAEKQIEQAVLKQWFSEFLEILQGYPGFASIHFGKLILTLPDKRMVNVLKACKGVVLMDATLSKEDLALKLEYDSAQIPVIRQKQAETPNLKLTQVTDLGWMGMQRGAEQQRRLKAIFDHYQQLDPTTKIIDFKKFDADGAWWRDSRGVNDFIEVQTLILAGTPCQNIHALLADYAVLTGCSDLEDEGFKAFVDRKIRSDIMQAIGRLRANRRLDEQLQVILISDFDLGLPNIEQVKASSITEEAAGKFERFTMLATKAIVQLREAGQKATQSAVAAITGYSQQYISRNWKLLLSLLEDLYSGCSKPSRPSPCNEDEPIIQAAVTVLEAVTSELAPSELPDCIEDLFFQSLTSNYWESVLARTSDRAKFALLECLIHLCPVETLEELDVISG